MFSILISFLISSKENYISRIICFSSYYKYIIVQPIFNANNAILFCHNLFFFFFYEDYNKFLNYKGRA